MSNLNKAYCYRVANDPDFVSSVTMRNRFLLGTKEVVEVPVRISEKGEMVYDIPGHRVTRKRVGPPRPKQPRPCPNAAQVALFNELGLGTWSEVIDAGLMFKKWEQERDDRFAVLMEKIKEQMEHA